MLPLVEHTIRLTIVNDSKSKKCDINCGVDWSSAETMARANQQIKARFNDEIRREYLNLSEPMTDCRASELKRQVKNKNLSLPLLLINDRPRISGQFDIRMLI